MKPEMFQSNRLRQGDCIEAEPDLSNLARKPMKTTKSQSGISVIEVLLASLILVICALGMIGLVSTSIASNNRNKVDSTQTMLTKSIIEQVYATLIGTGTSSLDDC